MAVALALVGTSSGYGGSSKDCFEPYTAANCFPNKSLSLPTTVLLLRSPGFGGVASIEVVYSTMSVGAGAVLVLNPYIINIGPDEVPLRPKQFHGLF